MECLTHNLYFVKYRKFRFLSSAPPLAGDSIGRESDKPHESSGGCAFPEKER